MDPEKRLLMSWEDNANAWVQAVREKEIASRAVTDQAIVEHIVSLQPASVMDIGCGEGWLARALSERGIPVAGFDAVEALVASAREQGGGFFYQFSYDDMAQGKISLKADVLVCNFSLLGKEPEERMLRALPNQIRAGGALVIQTVHPASQDDQQEGWREESWQGFGAGFSSAAPWYFRPLAAWHDLVMASGFKRVETQEVMDPDNDQPVSLIITAFVD